MVRNLGGIESTIMIACGWGARGSPREINNKLKIHKRHCDVCNETNFIDVVATRRNKYKYTDGTGTFKKTKRGNAQSIKQTGTVYDGNKIIEKKITLEEFNKNINE